MQQHAAPPLRGAPARQPRCCACARWQPALRSPPPTGQGQSRQRHQQRPPARRVWARALPEDPPPPPPGAGDPKGPAAAAAPADVPALRDGIDWYCYTVLWLLFLVDFTPLGSALSGGPDTPLRLAAFQAGAFFAPTLWFAWRRGWDLRKTFGLAAPSVGWAAAGLVLGPAVWALTTGLISMKTGVWVGDAGPDAAAAAAGAAGPLSDVLAASMEGGGPQQVAALFATVAAAPAVMEELLFRGFLLTALQSGASRFGRVDAVALAGALFAAIHLSVDQFFPLSVLGFAAGGAAVLSGSVVPAVLLHAGYNATGLAVGMALRTGGGA